MPLSLRPLLLAAGFAFASLAAPVVAQESGAYLAARVAGGHSDYRAAGDYYARALIADPSNPYLQEAALIAYVALSDVDRSLAVARSMDSGKNGNQIAAMVLLAEEAHRGAYDAGLARLEAGVNVGQLIEGLYRAWALVGLGQMSEATGIFDAIADAQGMGAFGLYHKALALALVGDYEGADAIFAGKAGETMRATRRGVLAHAQILSQLERNPAAVELLDAVFGTDLDPVLADMRARLVAGEALPFSAVTSASDGLAEVFFTLAGALSGETPDAYTLVYARLGQYLRPDHVDAILMAAGILEQQGQYDLATEAYAQIPRDNPAFHAAELGRAEALVRAERTEAAIEVLEQLTRSHPDLPGVWTALGDTLRREERYDDASVAYDKAITLLDTPGARQWFIYYARGIAHERSKRWDAAEADFRKALELSPEQPQVLNYLGYSYVEKNQNLAEALGMIERAVAARPDDGYIVDSLGWAYFRLGRYPEAVVQMERAIETMPVDSLVNDHLGDVYWAVGRKREAEFQWKRALSFEPETEADAARIRRKLELGLDAVLAEEGAAPLLQTAAPANGN